MEPILVGALVLAIVIIFVLLSRIQPPDQALHRLNSEIERARGEMTAHSAQLRSELARERDTVAMERSRNEELVRTRDQEVANRLDAWKRQELEALRRQELDAARVRAQADLQRWKNEETERIAKESIARSKATIAGKATEHLVPYLKEFPWNPKDARFIGSPVDFVVFDGLDEGSLRNVVFVEVKAGSGALSGRERQIKESVNSGRVRWHEVRVELGTAQIPDQLLLAETALERQQPSMPSTTEQSGDGSAPERLPMKFKAVCSRCRQEYWFPYRGRPRNCSACGGAFDPP